MNRLSGLVLLAGLAAGGGTAEAGLVKLATFDTLEEGFHGTTLTDGGITFFDPDARTGEGAATLAIDNVAIGYAAIPTFADFSVPNVLQMNAFGLGPEGPIFSGFGEIWMATGFLETAAFLDVFHAVDPRTSQGNSIRLEAYLGDFLVAYDSVEASTCCVYGDSLSISGVSFDRLRIAGVGPSNDGVFFGAIDNVGIVPEPGLGAMFLVGLGVLLSGRRGG